MQTKISEEKLNLADFDKLHFKSSNGTDIEIGLADNHIWGGSGNRDENGLRTSPNIPGENWI